MTVSMKVIFSDNFYHCLKTFYEKKDKTIAVTHCGLNLPYEDVVNNDSKVTIPHCLKCLNHLMG